MHSIAEQLPFRCRSIGTGGNGARADRRSVGRDVDGDGFAFCVFETEEGGDGGTA